MVQPADNLVKNAIGPEEPGQINGEQAIPFKGAGQYKPAGSKLAPRVQSYAHYIINKDKRVHSLKEALHKVGMKDGMTISTHHHFRNGGLLANQIFDAARERG